MNAFKKELLEQDRANPSRDTQPLLNRMERVIATMTSAAASLDSGNADEAAVAQEDASNALIAAKELILAQNARLTLLQDIFSFHRSVSRSFEATQDIVDQQNDLIAATEDADEDSAKDILPLMKNMLQCLTDVAPLLDAVAARLDAGSALLFAGSDMEDAIAAIEDGDFEDAVDAQQVAADSLGKVQVLIQSVREQTNYLAEMIQYLHESMTDLAVLESDQTQIRLALEAKPESMTADVVTRLENLQKSAVAQGQTLKSIMGSLENYKVLRIKQETARLQQLQKTTEPIVVTEAPGTAEFTKAAELMAEALRLGKSGDAAAAVEQMKLAEAVLKENEEQIFTVITMLHGLSIVEVLPTSPPELPILLDALALASDQRQIFLLARFGKDDAMAECKKRQIKLDPKYLKLIQVDAPHPLLVKAQQHTQTAMQSTTRDEAIRYLTIADEALRQYIIEQALVLDTSLKPPTVSEPVPSESETDDLTVSDLVGSVSDFVSGEAPKDKRTEWEVLGTRNRAALNQNFARELPLEFRAMLKDYYEKVAK
jgi:tetratricopeptide (TPR) repeat protein